MNHKKIDLAVYAVIFLAVNAVILGICGEKIFAQTRGEGVGALLGKSSGDTEIFVNHGLTSPKSAVFVENREHEIRIEAALDSKGVFTFSFPTNEEEVGNLFIYGQDSLGQTSRVSLPGTVNNDILLSPTIANDNENTSYHALALMGYAYPGSAVDVYLQASAVGRKNIRTVADKVTGLWRATVYDLASGTYAAYAVASLPSGAESVESKRIDVVVELPFVPKIINIVSKAMIIPAAGLVFAPIGFGLGDIGYYLSRIVLALRSFLFFRRRKRTQWGVVYDAVTKAPVIGAIVRLYREIGGLVETEVTGGAGTFSFLPVAGRYTIRVVKPGYVYPSRVVMSKSDGEYGPIYHGEMFTVTDFSTPFILSIPLDSKENIRIGVIAKIRLWLRQIQTPLEIVLLGSGLLLSVVSYIFIPRWFNIAMILLYAFLLSSIVYKEWFLRSTWGVVTDETGKAVPLVSLSLLETTFHRQVKRRVSDVYGRYQFVASNGQYQIAITSDQWELLPVTGAYSGEILSVQKSTGLLIPKVVVRKKG